MTWLKRDAAYNGFMNFLCESGAKIEMVSIPNNHRHKVIKSSFGNFYCLYKERSIDSFNHAQSSKKYLEVHPEDKGHGESINVDSCLYAIERGYPVLVYLYPDESIYVVQTKKIRDVCSEYQMVHSRAKFENEHQLADDGTLLTVMINEKEYWFPMTWLQNFRKLMRGEV